MTWTRHWKVERQQASWNPFQDTPEALQDAIRHGAMFATVLALDGPPDGEKEPNRRGPLVFDLDCREDPALSLIEGVWLVNHLGEFGITPDQVELYLSGGKGMHIVVPQACLGAPPAPDLHLTHKKIAARLKAELELKTLDLSVYSGGKGRMFRLANVQRSNGRFKIPVSWTELRSLKAQELLDLTKGPRTLKGGRP